jgi:hypothetical protein
MHGLEGILDPLNGKNAGPAKRLLPAEYIPARRTMRNVPPRGLERSNRNRSGIWNEIKLKNRE